MTLKLFMLIALAALVTGQRPQFAGSRPIGYPELFDRTTTTTADGLDNRFGESSTTTQRLPIEANGDRDLVDRLSKLPIDQQPFWFINWQALEANRENPQTYPQKPSGFVDPVRPSNINSPNGPTERNSQTSNTSNSQRVDLSSRNGDSDTSQNKESLFTSTTSRTQTSTQTSRDNIKISSRNYKIQKPTNVEYDFEF